MLEIMFVEASLSGCEPLEGESCLKGNKYSELEIDHTSLLLQ
jgi:hypothetical protein